MQYKPRARAYQQVDVFGDTPYFGNPLAVVLDGDGLSDSQMQEFARWTNLSETTFLLPPTPEGLAQGADYRVRIFTPGYEMPFAGHPTLGSCHAWLSGGGKPAATTLVIQECNIGLVKIRREAPALTDSTRSHAAFAAPSLKRSPLERSVVQSLAEALGLSPKQLRDSQLLNNGPTFVVLLLDSEASVLALEGGPVQLLSTMRTLGVTGVGLVAVHGSSDLGDETAGHDFLISRSNREACAFTAKPHQPMQSNAFPGTEMRAAPDSFSPLSRPQAGDLPTVTVRLFFDHGQSLAEDPVTGSLNASLGQWLIEEGYAPKNYIAAQGQRLGVHGRVYVSQDADGQVWVGGDAVTCIRGEVIL